MKDYFLKKPREIFFPAFFTNGEMVTSELAGKEQFLRTVDMVESKLRWPEVDPKTICFSGCVNLGCPDPSQGSFIGPAVKVIVGSGRGIATVIPQTRPALTAVLTSDIIYQGGFVSSYCLMFRVCFSVRNRMTS